MMCETCQNHIEDLQHDNICKSCSISGAGYCDPESCPLVYYPSNNAQNPIFIVYNNFTKKCESCQHTINGYKGLNCKACTVNGHGKSDPYGCPREYYDNWVLK